MYISPKPKLGIFFKIIIYIKKKKIKEKTEKIIKTLFLIKLYPLFIFKKDNIYLK